MNDAPTPARPRSLPPAIGRYRILDVLGEGGMGTVYLAAQENPHREIALKVIRRDHASAAVLRRFEREAEVLGRLQHPGIAQVYEAGTADGPDGPVPYIAMERVRGVPLTAHPLARGAIVARLELFAQVCEAVHYAHQRGVIHRDLKPGNVLVDDEGRARVLDFGIARVADAQGSVATMTGEVLGSLAYMSPEQVTGDPLEIDVRSDVYALGVLLYELVSGKRPVRVEGQTFPSAIRAILNEEPTRLGTLVPDARGDLETIVGKALEKEKDRRYPSAQALADDVARFLAHEPITARPASAAYQLRKFARRNRALVGGAAVAAGALVVGTAASTWQAVRATAAERAAEAGRAEALAARAQAEARRREAVAAGTLAEERRAAADDARALAEAARAEAEASAVRAARETARAGAVNDFLQEMLTSADAQKAQGREITVAQVAAEAARRLAGGSMRTQPAVEASLHFTLGNVFTNAGVPDSARVQFERAYATWRAVHGPTHPEVGRAAGMIAQTLVLKGDLAGAAARYDEAIRILSRTRPANDPSLLDAELRSAYVLYGQSRYPEAFARLAAVERRARTGASNQMREILGRALRMHGDLLTFTGRSVEAEPLLREAVATNRTVAGERSPDVVMGLQGLVYNLAMQERPERLPEAARLGREMVALSREVFRDDPRNVANAYVRLGDVLSRMDSLEAAEPWLRQAVELRIAVHGAQHPDVAYAQVELGKVQERRQRFAAAESLFVAALEGRKASLGARHPAVASSVRDLGRLALARGDSAASIPIFLQAAEIWREARLHGYALTDAMSGAQTARRLGRLELADSIVRVSLAADTGAVNPLPRARLLALEGILAEARERPADAERAWLRADAVYGDAVREDPGVAAERGQLAGRLATLYARLGREADAASWRARAP